MASPMTTFDPDSVNSQATIDRTETGSNLTGTAQLQSQTVGSQSRPPTTGKASWWSSKSHFSKGKRSVLKAVPFGKDQQPRLTLKRERSTILTNIPADFLKAFNRQQREVCDRIISDVETSDQQTHEQPGNHPIGGDNYSFFASEDKDGTWIGSLIQGDVENESIQIKKADREAFEGSLGLAQEFACQLAIDGQVRFVVLLSPVNKIYVHAGKFAYRFSFRLQPISEVARSEDNLYSIEFV